MRLLRAIGLVSATLVVALTALPYMVDVPRGIDAEPSALLPWAAAPGARIIVADGVQSVVAEAGSPDDPALLLIHGFGAASGHWRHNAAALAKAKKAELVTGDAEFKALEKEIKIRWLKR